jgi:hypothetical protein
MGTVSPTAYFASISSILQSLPAGKQAHQSGQSNVDITVLAYCYAAVISMLDLAVIQN